MNNIITLDKITKSFVSNRKITVLNKINYNFKKGKIYSLMGPSGSGKSTLLNILSLIDRPTSGTLKFDNKEINFSKSDINDKIRAKKIGIVYQQNNLLSDFTALENVYLSRLSIDNNKPIGNGIITCLNMNQAINRKKKGKEAAKAVKSILFQ